MGSERSVGIGRFIFTNDSEKAMRQTMVPSEAGRAAAAYSVEQFCEAHSISRAMFYLLRKSGDGPRVMRVGRRTLVSTEAAEAWRRAREAA